MRTRYGLLVVVLFASVCLSGCSAPSQYTAQEMGRTLSYGPGQPVFDMEASPAIADTGSTIEVYISLLGSSLTYFRTAEGFRAAYNVSVRLLNPESEKMEFERMWPETVNVRTYMETQERATIRFAQNLPAPPGKYLVQVQIEDRQSQKVGSRYQVLSLHSLRGNEIVLGRLLLFWSSDDDAREPITAFHIAARDDSLLAAVDIYHLTVGSPVTLRLTVLRFSVDSAMATPPFYYFSSGGMMIEGRRLYPRQSDTVVHANRQVLAQSDREKVVFQLPSLPHGMYQLSIELRCDSKEDRVPDEAGVVHRYFSLMPTDFPSPSALGEMVRMLGYLATEKEKAEIDSLRTQEQLLRTFEEFWMRHVVDQNVARALIKKYYSRVEEANRLFSTFKEGWKSDRGIIYIVLGPPEYVDKRFDTELWHYNHPGTVQENMFQFRRVLFAPDDLLIEDFVLYRSGLYQNYWDRMVRKWRQGEVF